MVAAEKLDDALGTLETAVDVARDNAKLTSIEDYPNRGRRSEGDLSYEDGSI